MLNALEVEIEMAYGMELIWQQGRREGKERIDIAECEGGSAVEDINIFEYLRTLAHLKSEQEGGLM